MGFFILVLFIAALIFLIKGKNKAVVIPQNKETFSNNFETKRLSDMSNFSSEHTPNTSHQQRFEDRRLIERRRVHHNPRELHKNTQIKDYEIKEDDSKRRRIPYIPASSTFYLNSRKEDLGDHFDDERNWSRYGYDREEYVEVDYDPYHSDYDRNLTDYDNDRNTTDFDFSSFDRDQYEDRNHDYEDRDYY